MNRRRIGLTAIIAALAVLAALPLSGCGSSGTGMTGGSLDLFYRARDNMQSVESFRMEGTMTISFDGEEGPGFMSADYDMIYERKEGGDPLVKMEMKMQPVMSGVGDVDAYITEGRMYMQHPVTGEWFYQEADLSADLSDLSQSMSPQYLMDYLEAAGTVEVTADNMWFTEYLATLDADELLQEIDLEEMKQDLIGEGIPEKQVDEITSYLKQFYAEILERTRLSVVVDKRGGMISGILMRMEIDMGELMGILEEGEPDSPGGSMVMDMKVGFTDYGKAFGIELPGEALNARPIEEMEEMELDWEEAPDLET